MVGVCSEDGEGCEDGGLCRGRRLEVFVCGIVARDLFSIGSEEQDAKTRDLCVSKRKRR